MKSIDPPSTTITRFNNKPEWQPDQDPVISSLISSGKRFRNLTHTGKRVCKIRWLRSGTTLALPNYNATEHFVTGSWGEQENEVCLWRLSMDQQQDDRSALIDKIYPFPVIGNVSGIVSLSEDKFAFTTSKGVLAIFKVLEDSDEQGVSAPSTIHPTCASQLHTYKKTNAQCPATGIATDFDDSLVTVGEEGSIYQVSLSTNKVVRSFESADPISLTTVEFIGRREEIVTGNICGQVKIYDLRASDGTNKPGRTVHDFNEITGIKSLAQHPSQNHMLLVGYESGQLALQDLRQNSAFSGSSEPIAYLPPQSGGVSEMYFHQVNPDHFFTSSQNGELVNWMPGEPDVEMDGRFEDPTPILPDLNLECLKYGFMSKVMYSSQFPLNSLSISAHNRLIAAGDSGFTFCTELVL